jgi:hypothetical protein
VAVDPPCREDVGATQVVKLKCHPPFIHILWVLHGAPFAHRYGAWVHEQPVWFTADLIARIPNDFIPKPFLDALNQAAGGQRRSTVDMGTAELLTAPAAPSQALYEA